MSTTAFTTTTGIECVFSQAERDAVYRTIFSRRDMRHFRKDAIDEDIMQRLFIAAHAAPSVGFMQPWRFIRISEGDTRRALHDIVDTEREKTQRALGKRGNEFSRLKVEGILDCAEVVVVTLCEQRENYIFGRRTLPEMDICSCACAIQNLWLAARCEGIGVGWVSLFDPEHSWACRTMLIRWQFSASVMSMHSMMRHCLNRKAGISAVSSINW